MNEQRYTVYFYDYEKKWYVLDNQTCGFVAGSGTYSEQKAKACADEYNKKLNKQQ